MPEITNQEGGFEAKGAPGDQQIKNNSEQPLKKVETKGEFVGELDSREDIEKRIEAQKDRILASSAKESNDNFGILKGKFNFDQAAVDLAAIENAKERVERLVLIATETSPYVAVKLAKHLDDNYTLDLLSDQLHEEHVLRHLEEKGLIKEIYQ